MPKLIFSGNIYSMKSRKHIGSRLRELSADDIEQLKSFQGREHPLSDSFWSTVESAIQQDKSHIELHKCTCGTIIFVSNKYAKSSIRSFKRDPDGCECWHKKGAKDNVLAMDIKCNSALEIVSVAVEKKDLLKAHVFGHGYLPMDTNPTSFDYALWKMQLTMIKHKYFTLSKKERVDSYQYRYITELIKLVNSAERKNPIEFEKVSKHYFETKRLEIIDLINNGLKKWMQVSDLSEIESFSRVTKQYIPSTTFLVNKASDNISQRISFEASAFQDFYEITEIYNFIYNLIRVSNGNNFEENPFCSENIRGIPVIQKGKLTKGLAIEKIVEQCHSKELSRILKLAYNSKYRNLIPGHNDYRIDLKKSTLTNISTNTIFSIKKSHNIARRMKSIIDSFLIISGISVDLTKDTRNGLSMMGYLGVCFHGDKNKKPTNELTIYQYWTNAELDKSGANIRKFSVIPSPSIKGTIGLFLGNVFIVPGSYNLPIDKTSYTWLKSLDLKKKVRINRIVLALLIEYFLKFSKIKIRIDGADFVVIGSTEHKIPINEEYLINTLEFMKKLKPRDIDWIGGISDYEKVNLKKIKRDI